jgi:hypothetical protein
MKINPGSEVWRVAEQLYLEASRPATFETCLELAADVVAHAERKLRGNRVLSSLRVSQLARGVLAVLVLTACTAAHGQQRIVVRNGAQLDAALNLAKGQPSPVYIVIDQGCPPPRPTRAKIAPPQPISPEAKAAMAGVLEGSNNANTGWGGGPIIYYNPWCQQ